MSDLTVENRILAVLSKAYLPLTSREISRIAEININSTRTILQQMANRGEIEPIQMGPGSKNLYMYRKIENEGEIKILVIGKWIKKNLEESVDIIEIDEVQNIDNQSELARELKCNLFQCVGLMNFYELRKICGIHRFHSPDKINKIGVQRLKHIKWVEELQEGLKSPKAEMWSTAIIYFDNDKIEYNKLRDFEDQEIGVIIISYDGHVFDADKPGWILDGQQRMWALENIAINSENSDFLELIGPITILIGEFEDNDANDKLDFIRRTFYISNKTQNLPLNFRKDLLATLDESSQEILTKKDKIDTLIASIVNNLSSDVDSPFRNLIDISNLGLPRKQGEYISRGAMNYIVQELLEYEAFNKENLPIAKSDNRYKFNIKLIKDYFNAIRFIFLNEWEKPTEESRIRSRLVLTSFASLISKILHISVALSRDRENRFRVLVEELLKISEDERTQFDINSPLLLNLKNNQADIRTLTTNLIRIYAQNSQFMPEELQINTMVNKWKELTKN